MKEKIKALAKEQFEYEPLKLRLSQEEIRLQIQADGTHRGSFMVAGAEGQRVKGKVYSDSRLFRIMQPSFWDVENEIAYEIDASGKKPGESLSGSITIISSLAEMVIPYTIKVEMPYCLTSLGKIRDLFHFANLAASDYKESLEVFESGEFERVFLKNESERLLYEGLIRSKSPARALEEFLITIHKKTQVHIKAAKTVFTYENCKERMEDAILLKKDCWGYEEYTVECESPFITLSRDSFHTWDFMGSEYALSYFVEPSRLHMGKNYAVISISSITERIEIRIEVWQRENEEEHKKHLEGRRRHLLEMQKKAEEAAASFEKELQGADGREKVSLLQKQLEEGSTSPAVYGALFQYYKKFPEHLKHLDGPAIAVLHWGIRHHAFTPWLAAAYAIVAMQERQVPWLALQDLMKLYEEFSSKELLEAVCRLLIQKEKKENRYIIWYQRGVAAELRVQGLYEAYMEAMEGKEWFRLPKSVLMYFRYESRLSDEKKAYLYACVLKNRERDSASWTAYERNIEAFVRKQILKGRIDKNLHLLYKEYLGKGQTDAGILAVLPEVLFKTEIICQNLEIAGVHVIHKEKEGSSFVPLEAGRCMVDLCTENAMIFMEDKKGNRYVRSVEYERVDYRESGSVEKQCYPYYKSSGKLLLYLYEKMNRYQEKPEDEVQIQRRFILLPDYRKTYKGISSERLIQHYYDNMEEESLKEMLRIVDMQFVNRNFIPKIIDYCMIHNLKEKAIYGLMEYGPRGVSVNRLLRFITEQIEEADMELRNSFFFEICRYLFQKGKYNETILSYLVKHLEGSTGELLLLWKNAADFDVDTYELEERLLGQVLFTEQDIMQAEPVFLSHYKKGCSHILLQAWLNAGAFSWLMRDNPLSGEIFQIIFRELKFEKSETQQLALLKYYSGKTGLEEAEKDFCREKTEALLKEERYFAFLKGLGGQITLPSRIINHYFVEVKERPGLPVKLHYRIQTEPGREDYKESPMKEIYPGIYGKELVLFQDELLQYAAVVEEEAEKTKEETGIYSGDVWETEQITDYGLINLMLATEQMKEEKTLTALMEHYIKQKAVERSLFEIL